LQQLSNLLKLKMMEKIGGVHESAG